jgi:hypothetical protein
MSTISYIWHISSKLLYTLGIQYNKCVFSHRCLVPFQTIIVVSSPKVRPVSVGLEIVYVLSHIYVHCL